LNTKYYWI